MCRNGPYSLLKEHFVWFLVSLNGKHIILIFCCYFLMFMSHLMLSVTIVFLYVSYSCDVFRGSQYLLTYNWLNVSHSENYLEQKL